MIEVKMVICIAVVLMFPTIPIRMLGIRALAQRCNKDGDSRWQQPWEPCAIRRQRTRLGKCCLASAGAAGECGGWKVAEQVKLQTYSKSPSHLTIVVEDHKIARARTFRSEPE